MFNINFDYILCFAFILSTIMSMPIWKRFAITKQVNKYTYKRVCVCVCFWFTWCFFIRLSLALMPCCTANSATNRFINKDENHNYQRKHIKSDLNGFLCMVSECVSVDVDHDAIFYFIIVVVLSCVFHYL